MPLSEPDLVLLLRARAPRAMTLFYHGYRPALYAAVRRIVRNPQSAEDVLQESLVKIWLALDSYDATQSRLFTWAAKICCNTAIDHVRSSHYRVTARMASLEQTQVANYPAPPTFNPEHLGLSDLLRDLRPEHRRVLDLLYLQGYTQVEAAEALQVPVGTVKTWSLGARRRLARLPL